MLGGPGLYFSITTMSLHYNYSSGNCSSLTVAGSLSTRSAWASSFLVFNPSSDSLWLGLSAVSCCHRYTAWAYGLGQESPYKQVLRPQSPQKHLPWIPSLGSASEALDFGSALLPRMTTVPLLLFCFKSKYRS